MPCRVHKEKRGSPQIQGLPGKKKGDRENLSPRIWWWLRTWVQFRASVGLLNLT